MSVPATKLNVLQGIKCMTTMEILLSEEDLHLKMAIVWIPTVSEEDL